MKVAVKVLQVDEDKLDDAREEYHVLRDFSDHPNLPDYYGTYVKRADDGDQLWFVMEVGTGAADGSSCAFQIFFTHYN